MGLLFWVGLAVVAAVLSFGGFFTSLVVQRHHEGKKHHEEPKKEGEAKPANTDGKSNDQAAGTPMSVLRRRSSAQPASNIDIHHERRGSASGNRFTVATGNGAEQRRPSFQTTSPPFSTATSPEPRRSSLLTPNAIFETRRASFQGQSVLQSSTSPTLPTVSSPSSPRLKKQTSNKGVTFQTPDSTPSSPNMTSSGLPAIPILDEFGGHVDAVESAAFSEEGLLATGGGPEDVFVKIYNRGMGTVGTLRHAINVHRDCGKHDGPSILSFAVDEGKKSTLLLVGTRSERMLLGYKLSKSAQMNPLLVFAFETKHGSPIAGAVGFIPKEATTFFDPGVFVATCARGTREVKVWSPKGSPLFVLDCECWTAGLRLSPHGKHLGVMSSGGGPGIVIEIKRDKYHHLKFHKTKLQLPIEAPGAMSPQISNRRSVVGDLAYQAAQDMVFSTESPGATLVCCRVDVNVQISHVADIDAVTTWEIDTLVKPEPLLAVSPTHTCLFIPKAEGRQMHVIIARGKNVFFFDTALALIGVLEGRREDGDVIGVSLSPKIDFVVIVAFGATVARTVSVQ